MNRNILAHAVSRTADSYHGGMKATGDFGVELSPRYGARVDTTVKDISQLALLPLFAAHLLDSILEWSYYTMQALIALHYFGLDVLAANL